VWQTSYRNVVTFLICHGSDDIGVPYFRCHEGVRSEKKSLLMQVNPRSCSGNACLSQTVGLTSMFLKKIPGVSPATACCAVQFAPMLLCNTAGCTGTVGGFRPATESGRPQRRVATGDNDGAVRGHHSKRFTVQHTGRKPRP